MLSSGELGPLAKSVFPLPPLSPPQDGLEALLDVPTTARLHAPIQIRLIVRNRRPTRSANIVVQVDFDSSDGFVLAGPRAGRIPVLPPGGEETMIWNAIPIECGTAQLPKIRVTDRRAAAVCSTPAGAAPETALESMVEPVPVVDLRRDERTLVAAESSQSIAANAGKKTTDEREPSDITVLVLP